MFHPKGPSLLELARQWLSSTERGYDLLAPKFDYTPFRTPDAVLAVVAERLPQSGPVNALLDVCCGTGAAMQWLGPLCRRRMVGIDISAGMLQAARSNLQSALGQVQPDLVRGNVLALPFGPSFDLVVSFGGFGHFLPQDRLRLIRQIAGTLKPGGRFVFVTSEMPPKRSRAYWFCRGFNAAAHLRNWLVKPPFVMHYFTFLLPEIGELLRDNGFTVAVYQPFEKPLERLRLVIATRE